MKREFPLQTKYQLPVQPRWHTCNIRPIKIWSKSSLRLAPQVYSIEFRRATSICACPAKSISIKPGLIALFTSPGYPLEYCNDLNCTSEVVVQSPSTNISYSSVVRAKLNGFFIMEADVDYLQMIDKKALIALSGHAQKINYFTFDHHQVGLSFVTDHSVAEGGFNISLEVYSKPYYCMCPGTPQMLQDLNHTHDYTFDAHCAYMDCFWQIRPPLNFEELDRDTTTEEPPSESLYRILLNVGFKLQAATEFIEVVNGQFLERNAERTRLDVDMMPEEGDQQQRSFSYENAHLVTLWYHREGGISNQPRSLHIDYQWREKCLCGSSHLTAELDQCKLLTSPDYPLVYCNDLRCEYQIVAEPGLRVVLNVTDFFTEINQDYLFVFEGNSSQSKHIQALSGIEVFSPAIYSQGNVLTLLFTTDVSLSMRGFKLCYKAEMTPEYKLQLAQEESDKQAAASSKVIVWSVVCVLTLLVLLVISIGLFLLYARSKQMMNDSSSGDSSVRFVRGPRTAESHFALINPVFQSILPTRQN
uniref:CUB domain-containing protein n=1 Tax=Ditylenchus dipsaci TaxID=166011 RepID=A0A915CVE9_9BILA